MAVLIVVNTALRGSAGPAYADLAVASARSGEVVPF